MSVSLSAVFEEAGIPMEVPEGPLRDVNRDIFQLDIHREPAECVQLWPGASDNQVEALSVDPALGQLVLAVKEPRRPYTDRIRIREGRVSRADIEVFVQASGGGRVLRPRGSSWLVERYTEPAERRFLIGFDQRHLFAAQINSGNTVREAHEALKPVEVLAAEERWPGQVVRQGEWFFAPVTSYEESEIRRQSWRRGRLPGGGEPHWAESLVALEGDREAETGWRRFRLFARGTVHHRDHRTVSFDRWRRVHLNAAVRRRSDLARGFYWID